MKTAKKVWRWNIKSTFHSGYITMKNSNLEVAELNRYTFHSGYITMKNSNLEVAEVNRSTFHSGYITMR